MIVPIDVKSLFNPLQEKLLRKIVIYILLSLMIFLQSSPDLTQHSLLLKYFLLEVLFVLNFGDIPLA